VGRHPAVSGETDLGRLLATLSPAIDPARYVFLSTDAREAAVLADSALMWFREDEGITLVVPAEAAAAAGRPVFRRITLGVHSSLAAVGLTAAVSNALTEAGISANIVAAFYHDHVFVPAADSAPAMAALVSLQQSAGAA
jgi:hypothetical protein